jgi:general secretion pathway protein C
MVSYLSWAANAVLFVAACFLAANTVNTILAAMLAAPVPQDAAQAATAPEVRAARWTDRQVILDRNLFNSSTMDAVALEPIQEEIEATKLPLQLLGTVGAELDALAWAVVQDTEKRETLVVTIGDDLKGKATVTRIERRRLVLRENGVLRELTIGDDTIATSSQPTRTASRASAARSRFARARASAREPSVRQLADDRFSLPRDDVEQALSNPADILSQARFLPKYEGEEMLGFQINSIKAGSVLEEFGIQNGDIITEFNGITIDSPTESARLLQEFSDSSQVTLVVESEDGETRTINVDLDE